MPHAGLVTPDGTQKTWAEVRSDIISNNLEWLAPATPAIVQYAYELSSERADVNEDEVSASQFETGMRELLLKATVPYYSNACQDLASSMGTKSHNLINKDVEGIFVAETRLFFEEDGVRFGSAKNDTFYVPGGVLEDLKCVKWYSAMLMLKQGALEAKPGYVMQMNLFRALMKMPQNQEILFAKYPWLKPEHLVVKRMQLAVVPPDLNGPNAKEAKKLLEDPRCIPIHVPFLNDEFVLDGYRKKYHAKQVALATNYAPLCDKKERWQTEYGFPRKCADFCPVKNDCRAMSASIGETHPLDAWEEQNRRRKSAKEAA